jgi:phospholipid/cholesterol/gamma-HCH transport system substrate-binding protein
MVFMQESVSGLSLDAPVEFNGVNVGSVKSIDLNHQNPQLVEILLSVKSNTPVTQGTVATLTTRGVTGITYVALKDKSTDLRKLTVRPGELYPIIKTAPSLFLRLDTALTQLSNNLRLVTESIQSVLDKENLKSIKETLHHLDSITGTLSQNSEKINQILTNTSKASERMAPLLQSGNNAIRLLETQTLPTAYRVLNNLDTMTQSLNQITSDLKENPSILIRGTTKRKGPGETP